MAYVIQDTIWPSPPAVDQQTKDLIGLFYSLADHTGPDAGPRMAKEIFTDKAVMIAGTGEFRGSAAISRSRDKAWEMVISRHHTVQRVYVNDEAGCDLMVLGRVKMLFRNGKDLEMEFAGRLLLDAESQTGGQPRLKMMQVFADSAPAASALKES